MKGKGIHIGNGIREHALRTMHGEYIPTALYDHAWERLRTRMAGMKKVQRKEALQDWLARWKETRYHQRSRFDAAKYWKAFHDELVRKANEKVQFDLFER